MLKWLHHILNPHCQQCREEELQRIEIRNREIELERERVQEDTICKSCETLKVELEVARAEKKQLLDLIVQKNSPTTEAPVDTTKLTPIMPRHIPWSVRRQQLEENDRHQAQLLAKKKKELEPDTNEKEEIKALEDEILNAERERENQTGTN